MSKRTWTPKNKYFRNINQATINQYMAREKYTRPSYKETLKLIKQVNSRITKLRQSGITQATYAEKKLKNRLQTSKIGAFHRGRVKINPNMTETQLLAITKASKQFLESKTSTPKGIERVQKAQIKGIQNLLSTEDRGKVSKEDAELYFDAFSQNDFNYFTDYIDPSDLFQLIEEAKEKNASPDTWISMLGTLTTINDEETRERAIRLYNKYVQ